MTEINLPKTSVPKFSYFTLVGDDSIKFLQGQVTCNIEKLTAAQNNQPKNYQATAISNLKGRIQFGIWIAKIADNHYEIVISADCAHELSTHIKKFGAFSKISLSESNPIYPCVINDEATFTVDKNDIDDQKNHDELWIKKSIETGNYWITKEITDVFQPQELRLHQRGGIDYDKGCYLGQEVIARIYFKSSPKSFMHRIAGRLTSQKIPLSGDIVGEKGKIKVVNAIAVADGFEALVLSRSDILDNSDEFKILAMPNNLMVSVARKP